MEVEVKQAHIRGWHYVTASTQDEIDKTLEWLDAASVARDAANNIVPRFIVPMGPTGPWAIHFEVVPKDAQ